MSERAKALEAAAKSGDEAYIEANHRAFAQSYREMTEKIGTAFGIGGGKENPDGQGKEDGNTHILVVDDDPMNLWVAQSLLGKKYAVHTAASGEEAMKFLASGGQHTDLILLDIHMPAEDGFAVIQRLKADGRLRDIPVIFLTADDDQSAETEGFKAGAMDFIRKPFIPDIMLQRIGRILELHRLQTKLSKR